MRILTSIQGATDLPTWEILSIPCDQPGGGCNIGTGRCIDDWKIGIRPSNQLSTGSDNILSPEKLRQQYEQERQDRVVAVCQAVRDLAESYYENEEEVGKKKTKVQTTKQGRSETSNEGLPDSSRDHLSRPSGSSAFF
jgi:hypothetical protein